MFTMDPENRQLSQVHLVQAWHFCRAHETRRENAVFSVQDRSGEKECEATSITLAAAATGTLLVHLSLVKPCEPPNFKQGESSRGRSPLPSIDRMMSI